MEENSEPRQEFSWDSCVPSFFLAKELLPVKPYRNWLPIYSLHFNSHISSETADAGAQDRNAHRPRLVRCQSIR